MNTLNNDHNELSLSSLRDERLSFLGLDETMSARGHVLSVPKGLKDVAVTVFYSNYSGNCKALLQRINNSNLMDILSIKFINIDNSVIKQIISKKFSVVPSIVVMIEDEISLYTGDNVFEWFNIYASSNEDENILHDEPVQSMLKETSISPPQNISEGTIQPQKQTKSILEIAAELSKDREKL